MADLIDSFALQPIYQKLREIVGEEEMLKVFEYYHGSQISFPSHLYNRKAAAVQIRKRYNGANQAELGRYYGYSQRWVARTLAEGSTVVRKEE